MALNVSEDKYCVDELMRLGNISNIFSFILSLANSISGIQIVNKYSNLFYVKNSIQKKSTDNNNNNNNNTSSVDESIDVFHFQMKLSLQFDFVEIAIQTISTLLSVFTDNNQLKLLLINETNLMEELTILLLLINSQKTSNDNERIKNIIRYSLQFFGNLVYGCREAQVFS